MYSRDRKAGGAKTKHCYHHTDRKIGKGKMPKSIQSALLPSAGRNVLGSAFAVSLLFASGALCTSAVAATAPIVHTKYGSVQGFINNGPSGATQEFLGIPYAEPPVGDLRWEPSRPHAAWSGTRNATAFGKTCAQITTLGVFAGPANANEDCLFLNVFAPQERGSSKHPVIVWIHGGGLVDGESNDYDGSKLANRGSAVVVTFNYRLGLLGYLGHPALDNEHHPFGNYGLMDQQLVLHWVRDNISAFGGDPNNVTLGGQSAGSTSTGANVISPAAKHLFHRAIFQSADLLTVAPLTLAEDRGTAFATAAGCPGSDAASASCLRGLSVSKILALQGTASASGPYVNGLMVDGQLVPLPADKAFATGQFNHMPIMNGNVRDELTFILAISEYFSGAPETTADYVAAITQLFSGNAGPGGGAPAYPVGTVAKVLAEYPLSHYATAEKAYVAAASDSFPGLACQTAYVDHLLAPQVPVYAYEFDYRNAPFYFPAMRGFVPMAAHTIDIQFLFPLYHGGPLGIAHPLNAQEERLSDELVADWTNFAATGNPNRQGNSPWHVYRNHPNAPSYYSENLPRSSSMSDAQFDALHHCGFWSSILYY